jgi:hypothetical protein
MISAENRRYIEDNWAKLSPAFRAAHNRLRQRLGMETRPPPKIDLYVPPRGPAAKPFDFSDKDFVAAGRQFLAPVLGLPGDEGFTINGNTVHDLRRPARRSAAEQTGEGFTIR